jgi:hypothetical protein
MAANSKSQEDRPPKLSRHRAREHLDLIAPYAKNIGRVLFEWNILHASLFRMFWAFIGDGGKIPRNLSTELWHSTASEDHQRRMIRVMAKNVLVGKTAMLRRVLWLLDVADEIAAYRNIAAHFSLTISPSPVDGSPNLQMEIDGARRTAALKHIFVTYRVKSGFWDDLAGDLFVLSQYADVLQFLLAHKAQPPPWLYRPRLLSLSAIRETNASVNRMAQKPKRRKRQRRSSSQVRLAKPG